MSTERQTRAVEAVLAEPAKVGYRWAIIGGWIAFQALLFFLTRADLRGPAWHSFVATLASSALFWFALAYGESRARRRLRQAGGAPRTRKKWLDEAGSSTHMQFGLIAIVGSSFLADGEGLWGYASLVLVTLGGLSALVCTGELVMGRRLARG